MTNPLPETNPLPRLANCPYCPHVIRLRADGTLYQHPGLNRPRCPGSRQPIAQPLEPTFVRWLHANAPRRDGRTNRVTGLAQMMFRGCTRSPSRTPADMLWTTAEELHEDWHRRLVDLSGSEERRDTGGEHCDWVCRDVELAGRVHAALLAEAEIRAVEPAQCDVEFIGGSRCTKSAGHRPSGSDDPHTP